MRNSENSWRRGLEKGKSFTTASTENVKIIEDVRQRHTRLLGSKKQKHLSVHEVSSVLGVFL